MSLAANLPGGRRGRLLALAVTATGVLTLWFAIADPLLDFHTRQGEELTRQAAKLRAMTRLAAQLPDLARQQEAAARSAPPASLTLAGDSDAVAAAALQNKVQELAAGTTLASTEILAAAPVGAYRRIGLKLSLEGSWPALAAMLKAIAQASPPILVDDLQIHASPPQAGAPAGQTLRATLAVYGFRAGGAGAGKQP
jgi:general secretion pathway protein M